MALVFVNIIEEVAHDHVQNAPFVKNWVRSCVQAAEQDLLVAYPVINIYAIMYSLLMFWDGCIFILLGYQ